MIPRKKLKIAVSACLIGLKYRYDGTSKMNMTIIDAFRDRADFIPVCPEIECGLLVPRPPMHLEVSSKGTRIKITESGEDVTEQMREWGLCKLDKLARLDIDAYIFKARSPSCGLKSTKICNAAGRCINENGNGIFTAMVLRSFPKLRVCQEDDFQSVLECFLD